MTLTEILTAIGDDSITVQFLNESTILVKDKKRTKDTEITFCTNQTNAANFLSGSLEKLGIIIWIDRSDWDESVAKLSEVNHETTSN